MKPKWQREIAEERIEILFEEAERTFPEHKDRANRYVEIARNIAMSYRIPIPKKLKKKFCGECHSYLRPGVNCKVEMRPEENVVEYRCGECGHVKRYPYNER